jgi:hypothetical protein
MSAKIIGFLQPDDSIIVFDNNETDRVVNFSKINDGELLGIFIDGVRNPVIIDKFQIKALKEYLNNNF